jgi:glycerol-3-phosphate dehydrogenase (NAD(P)+)
MKTIGVIGGGSWGTALVSLLSNDLSSTHWCIRSQQQIDNIIEEKRNKKYLPNCFIDLAKVKMTTSVIETIAKCDVLVVATPAEYLLATFSKVKESDLKDKFIISATKGVVPQKNLTPYKFFQEIYNNVDYGVISGPCHAEEVAMSRRSYLTFSAYNTEVLNLIINLMSNKFVSVKESTDVFGTELSAILKNIYALLVGVCHGLGYGDNFLSVLISSSASELGKIIYSIDPKQRKISDSAYLGDLLVTCYSLHSRNRKFGNFIGRGYSVKNTKESMNMVAEGYNATRCIHELLGKEAANYPILETAYKILYKNASPKNQVKNLESLIS